MSGGKPNFFEITSVSIPKDEAFKLFMLLAIYQHNLQKPEFELAKLRLSIEFEKFEQWLRSRGIYL